MDTYKVDAEIEAAKMQAERMRLEVQRLHEKNQAAVQQREWNLIHGLRPDSGRFI